VPLYVPASASAFGILVVKQTFGGLGKNWMNPALGGVVFALLSWGDSMTRWIAPRGGLPRPFSRPRKRSARRFPPPRPTRVHPSASLRQAGIPSAASTDSVVSWLNVNLFARLGIPLAPGSFDVLVGHVVGRIGDISAPLLLAGAAVLLARRILPVATCRFPTSQRFVVLAAVFGGPATGQGWLAGGSRLSLLLGKPRPRRVLPGEPTPLLSPDGGQAGGSTASGSALLTFFLRFFGTLGDGWLSRSCWATARFPCWTG